MSASEDGLSGALGTATGAFVVRGKNLLKGPRIVVRPEVADGLVVASISGGKDSTAMALALLEAEVPFRAVFADTQWEAQETYEHLDRLERLIGPIARVRAKLTMRAAVHDRAGFPSRLQRWCTRELKLTPLLAFREQLSAEDGRETIAAVGIRAAESARRAEALEWEDHDKMGLTWRPILSWSVADVLAIHHRHGVTVNALYQRGHARVGCFPCVMSSKEDIRLIAEHAPERIDDIERLEAEAQAIREARNAETPGRYTHQRATFFMDPDRQRNPKGIREVVTWAKTDRGGRQLPMFAPVADEGCFRWGLCDAPAEEASR
jgi:3'-phosphoadenosine 5'-phosphosulfate sulfotransferase (PAPS reductase)/FAD synthetase